MEVYKYLEKDKMVLDMKARDRLGALSELLQRVFPARTPEHEKVLRILCEAEDKRCSAVGRATIIAHAVIDGVREMELVFGRSKTGIPWDAPDGRLINLLWLFIHPLGTNELYLDALAQTVKICRRSESWKQLMELPTPEEIIDTVSRAGVRQEPRS